MILSPFSFFPIHLLFLSVDVSYELSALLLPVVYQFLIGILFSLFYFNFVFMNPILFFKALDPFFQLLFPGGGGGGVLSEMNEV